MHGMRGLSSCLLLIALSLNACLGQNHYGGDGKGREPLDYAEKAMPKTGDMPPGPGPVPPQPGPQPFPPRPVPPGPPGPMMPCRMDFMRFCAFRVSDMQNPEVIVECMMSHQADLNPECKEEIVQISQIFSDFHAACDAPMKTFYPADTNCTDELPHKPWLYHQCIINHLPDLGHACLAQISDILKKHQGRPHGPPGPAPGPPGPGPHHLPEWAMITQDMGNMHGPPDSGMMGPGRGGPMGPGRGGPMPPDANWSGEGHRGGGFFSVIVCAGAVGAFVALFAVFVVKRVAQRRARNMMPVSLASDHLMPVPVAPVAAVDGKFVPQLHAMPASAYSQMA